MAEKCTYEPPNAVLGPKAFGALAVGMIRRRASPASYELNSATPINRESTRDRTNQKLWECATLVHLGAIGAAERSRDR